MGRMTDEEYMQLAIKQAWKAESMDEVPIGAVVVRDGEVIAEACNMKESTHDPAGHAELIAMRTAAESIGAWRLSGCTVYVTLEPCIMCAGLMHQARINRCVYGATDPKAGALGSLYSINEDERLNHIFEVEAGVCQEECSRLLSEFFSKKRRIKNK